MSARQNETDPRRRPRQRSNRDRHAATAMVSAGPIGAALAHIGLQLRLLGERLLSR
jgi:hypothetical protein